MSRRRFLSRDIVATLRYVVLFHGDFGRPHFDLMIETRRGSKLATWRCPHWPPLKGDRFKPIAKHRRVYLDYEGPISGRRGGIKRAAEGKAKWLAKPSRGLLVQLDDSLELHLPANQK